MFGYVKRFTRVFVLLTAFVVAFLQYQNVIEGLTISVAQGAEITALTISSSASPNDINSSVTYTVTFTPVTTGATSVQLVFMAPPDKRFGLGSAAIATGSSSVFTSITNSDSNSGSININASAGLTASTSYTLKLSGITNPSTAGKFSVEIQTRSGFSQTDKGITSITVGTIAITGKVSKPASVGGGAAANVWVNARQKDDPSKQFGSNTDSSGVFGIGGLTSGKTYILDTFVNDPTLAAAGIINAAGVEITYSGSALTQNIALELATKTVTGTLKRASGAVIAAGRISAMRMDKPGFNQTTTDSSGNYTLKLSGGKYEIRPDTYAGPGQQAPDYAYSGPGTTVSFANNAVSESKASVDFSVVTASATIKGKLSPAPSGFSGIGIMSRGGFGTGTGVNNGSFSVKVPPGTYELNYFDQSQKYALPARDPISIKADETQDLGTITLIEKVESIVATVLDDSSKAITGFNVGCFKPGGGDFGMGATGADGKATLKTTAGDYMCMAMSGGFGGEGEKKQGFLQQFKFVQSVLAQAAAGDIKYVTTGGPKIVKVTKGTAGSVSFSALKADATIAVTVTDTSGNALTEHGFIEAEVVGTTGDRGFGGGLGQPIDPNQPGVATLRVPKGKKYSLRMMTPPGSGYSSGDPVEVDLTSTTSASATIKLLKNDSTISGKLVDEDGNTVKGIFAFVSASNKKGAFVPGDVNSANGTYSMSVPSAGGELTLGYHVDPASGYFPQPISNNTVTPVAGGSVEKNIVMVKATTTVNVTVKDPDGAVVANAGVLADNRIAQQGGIAGGIDSFFGHNDKTDANGKVTLKFPAGKYKLKALLPPEKMREKKWTPPTGQELTLVKGDSKDVTLTFQKAEVELSGTVKDSSGNPIEGATVVAYSNDGEYIDTTTDSTGKYSVFVSGSTDATHDDDWHVVAKQDNNNTSTGVVDPLVSTDEVFDTGTDKSISKNLTVSDKGSLPTSITTTFDTDNSKAVSITDGDLEGSQVTMPQDALDSDGQGGNATVAVTGTVEVPSDVQNKPLGDMALDISAQDANGQSITSLNSSNVVVTIAIDQEDLTSAGYTVGDIGKSVTMSYVGSEGAYIPVEGSVTAVLKDGTGDGDTNDAKDNVMISGTTNHFTVFAVTASTDTTPPSAPTGISATDMASDGKVKIAWTKPTDSDFASVKIYRSTVDGTLGSAVHTGVTGLDREDTGLTNGTKYYYTVRAVDTAGNESTNTKQFYATPTKSSSSSGSSTSSLPKTGNPYPLIFLVLGGGAIILLSGITLKKKYGTKSEVTR